MNRAFLIHGILSILLALLVALWSIQPAFGQDNIDRQRMDRDIRIMESALDELFKTGTRGNTFQFSPRSSISGSWLPGFGVIFTIPDRTPPGIFGFHAGSGERSSHRFTNPLGDDGGEITEESVQNRITEFLVSYAPSIGQLSPDDKVLVIYGDQFSGGGRAAFFGGGITIHTEDRRRRGGDAEAEDAERLPAISMAVTRQDLDDLRSGRINPEEFTNRISTAVQHRDGESRKMDLQVFASVLETGLNENRDEVLRLIGKPSHLYLDNFGAIYQFNLRASGGNVLRNFNIRLRENIFDGLDHLNNLHFELPPLPDGPDSLHFSFDLGALSDSEELREAREQIRVEMESARRQIEQAREAYRDQLPEIQRQQEEARRELREKHREMGEEMERKREEMMSPEEIRESLENQLQVIRELMVDYGRTLSSLGEDHSLFLIVQLQHSEEELPRRVDLRIGKNDLMQLERGQITREQAMDRITERRF